MTEADQATGTSRLLWVNAVLLVLALAAAVFVVVVSARGGGVLSSGGGPDNRSGRAYDAVSEAARAETLAFMTVDYRTMDPLMKKVLDGATGQFKKEYVASSPQLRTAVISQQSESSGKVLSVAVNTIDRDSATVFVAADSQVSNKGTKGKLVPRYYRLQMDLTKVKGAWLVSKLQFVG